MFTGLWSIKQADLLSVLCEQGSLFTTVLFYTFHCFRKLAVDTQQVMTNIT